jgi:hypothetical protein
MTREGLVHSRMIQDGEIALLQSQSQDNWHTQNTTQPKKNTERTEHKTTLGPSTPKLHDSALRRENGAKRRRRRVRHEQRSSPAALTRGGEPQRRLQEDSGTRKRRRRRRRGAELSLGSSTMPQRGLQD